MLVVIAGLALRSLFLGKTDCFNSQNPSSTNTHPLVQLRTDQFWSESCFIKCIENLFLMICSECFHCDTKLYCCVSVCAYKLVMLQLNDVTLYVCDCLRHTCEFTRLIRKEYGYRRRYGLSGSIRAGRSRTL